MKETFCGRKNKDQHKFNKRENMTPYNQPSYPDSCSRGCSTCSRYPYVGRVPVGEEDSVDFIYQFVKERFVARNHQNLSIFCTASDIIGPPKFLNYGQISYSPFMTGYNYYDVVRGISTSPWENKDHRTRLIDFITLEEQTIKTNYIDIEFHEAVYPIRVSIYEIYTPGSVTQIWVKKIDSKNQWLKLWDESWDDRSQIHPVPSTSRLFSPPLSPCTFKTKMLRLVFKSSSSGSYTKLDAVMLIGTSDLIFSRNFEECLTNLLRKLNCMYSSSPYHVNDNLTADLKNAQLDIVHLQQNFSKYRYICKSNTGTSREIIPSYVQYFGRQRYKHYISLRSHSNCSKRIKLSLDESKELSPITLSALPDEILLEILKYLDFMTLRRMNQVDKLFNNLTRDPELYTRLNIRRVYLTHDIFSNFTYSCKYLKRLDLTRSMFDITDFVIFLDNCGRRLTHLRLRHCSSVNNFTLRKISEICKNLKELDLHGCREIDDDRFSYLEELNSLENLSLSVTNIQTQPLCKILQKNHRMRELHLAPVLLNNIIDLDVVAVELERACPDFEAINLQDRNNLTVQDISALANCKNLRKVIYEQCGLRYTNDVLSLLLSSCQRQRLEVVYLRNIIFTDRILELLTQCKNLEQLYLYSQPFRHYTADKFSVIIEQCPKLQEFHLIEYKISDYLVNLWKQKYPHVSVYTFDGMCDPIYPF